MPKRNWEDKKFQGVVKATNEKYWKDECSSENGEERARQLNRLASERALNRLASERASMEL
jgi:hypothetical protein